MTEEKIISKLNYPSDSSPDFLVGFNDDGTSIKVPYTAPTPPTPKDSKIYYGSGYVTYNSETGAFRRYSTIKFANSSSSDSTVISKPSFTFTTITLKGGILYRLKGWASFLLTKNENLWRELRWYFYPDSGSSAIAISNQLPGFSSVLSKVGSYKGDMSTPAIAFLKRDDDTRVELRVEKDSGTDAYGLNSGTGYWIESIPDRKIR